jgi:site-specific recombinase XerD
MFEGAPSHELMVLEHGPGGRDSPRLQTLFAAYKSALHSHESPNTRRAYSRDLDRFVWEFSEVYGNSIREVLLNLPYLVKRQHAIWYRDHLRDLISSRGRPLADATINRRLSVMSAVFREFVHAGIINNNPFKGLTAGYRCDPTPALSNEERQRLVQAPDFEKAQTPKERQRRLRDRCLLALLFVHGIRREEARLVKTGDITTNQGYQVLTVRQKGGGTISHRLHPKLFHYIEMYCQEFMPDDEVYLFTGLARNGNSEPGKAISAQAINDIVAHWARKAGITKKVTPHVGRATVITEALKKAPLQVVSRSIGHATIETTARYDRTRNRMDQAIMNYQACEL